MGTKEGVDVFWPERASFGPVLRPVGVVTSADVLRCREGQRAAKKQKKQHQFHVGFATPLTQMKQVTKAVIFIC